MTARGDNLRQGSFRGVPFNYQDAGGEHGRRGQLHEYPKRDVPEWEDLGRKGRQFALDVFVSGDDWSTQRNALIAACEKKSLGKLVHPLLGDLTVACTDCRWQETVTALGRADFNLTFLEGAPHDFTSTDQTEDTGATVDDAANSTAAASQNSFQRAFNTSGLPRQVGTGAASTLLGATDLVKGAIGFVKSDVGGAGSWFSYVSKGIKYVRKQYNDISGAVRLATGAIGSAIFSINRTVSWIGDITSLRGAGGILGSIDSLGNHLGSLIRNVSGLFTTGSGDGFQSWASQRSMGVARTVAVNAFASNRVAAAPDAAANAFLTGTAVVPAAAVPVTSKTVGGYSAATILSAFKLHMQIATATARPAVPPAPPVQEQALNAFNSTSAGLRAGSAAAVAAVPAQSWINRNAFAIYDVLRQHALIEAASALTAYPFASRTEALTLRDQVGDALDAEANLVDDDDLFRTLASLRIAVIRDVTARSAGLPDVSSVTLKASLPAVVLAHRLYGDPSTSNDLIARNDVRHPLFLPAGTPMEVLSNG